MTETITITIPDDPGLCQAAADYFARRAAEHQPYGVRPELAPEPEAPEPEAPEPPPAPPADVEPETAEPPPAPEQPAGVETDADGLPWDGRIHASSRALNKTDGKWRRRKNVDAATIQDVEAELRAAMAAGSPEPAPAPEQPPAAPAPEPEQPPADFPALMQRVTELTQQGRLDQAGFQAIVERHGFQSVASVGTRPDLIPAILADVEATANG